MPVVAVDQVFSAQPLNTWSFLSEAGQGCYIPAYQRPYSWDDKNVDRLLENAVNGIEQMLDFPSTISFLGTIIAVHDIHHTTVSPLLKQDMPGRVMSIIDGQQRLSTLTMLNIAFHNAIATTTASLLKGKDQDDSVKWLIEQAQIHNAQLFDAIVIDMKRGEGRFQFYPKIIRAMYDQWSRKEAQAEYRTPIARLVWDYIEHTGVVNTGNFQFKPLDKKGDVPANYRAVADTFKYISKEIVTIADNRDDSNRLPSLSKLVASKNIIEGLWNFDIPEDLIAFVFDGQEAKHYGDFSRMLNMLIMSKYVNSRIAFTIVTTKSEDDGFDMFEALNTTGEPLTAFETLIPRVLEAETLAKYENSPSHKYVNTIEEYLGQFKRAEEKQAATTELLIPFALAETGRKLPKKLSEQRRYLRDEHKALVSLDEKRKFLSTLANLSILIKDAWHCDRKTRPAFDVIEVIDEEVIVCFAALKDLNHHIAISPLSRFFDVAKSTVGEERQSRISDFTNAIKATAGFSMLWRGANGSTANIDSQYRKLMESGVPGANVLPLARRPPDGASQVSLPDYKRALSKLLDEAGIGDKEAWVKQASRIGIQAFSTVVAKFLLFCAIDDSVPDPDAPGLIVKGRIGIAPLFTFNQWINDDYFSVEHVAPQTKNDWAPSFYENSETIHRLGNLVLISKELNSSISNKGWDKKILMYRLIAAQTSQQQDEIKQELVAANITLTPKAEQIITEANFNRTCQSLVNLKKAWSVEIVETRSRRLAELAWDKVQRWLAP